MKEKERQKFDKACKNQDRLIEEGKVSPVYAAIGAIMTGKIIKTGDFVKKRLAQLGCSIDDRFDNGGTEKGNRAKH